MDDFKYNRYGQVQTGFDNSIDHSMFGHWRNPEFQELCQDAEMIDRQQMEMAINHNNYDNSDLLDLPF